jgi:hypothetical protein
MDSLHNTLELSAFGGRQLAMLGRLFLLKHPDLVKPLLSSFQKPTETDLSKITHYFTFFPSDIEGRRIFIASMLHLYSPGCFSGERYLLRGLVKQLSLTTNHHHSNISKMIDEVIQWYRDYDDFQAKVDERLKLLSNG